MFDWSIILSWRPRPTCGPGSYRRGAWTSSCWTCSSNFFCWLFCGQTDLTLIGLVELEGGSDLCHFNVVLILSALVVLMQVVGGEIRTLLPCQSQSQTFLWLFAKTKYAKLCFSCFLSDLALIIWNKWLTFEIQIDTSTTSLSLRNSEDGRRPSTEWRNFARATST